MVSARNHIGSMFFARIVLVFSLFCDRCVLPFPFGWLYLSRLDHLALTAGTKLQQENSSDSPLISERFPTAAAAVAKLKISHWRC